MNKATAARKDRQFLQHRSLTLRVGYRCGSYFKGCEHCGDTRMIPWGDGEKKVWLSGYDVFRIYQPTKQGYMYWCYQCGAKDLAAWSLTENNMAYYIWLTRERKA